MSDLSKHIENLKEYIRIDKQNIEYTGDFGEFCKGHIEDVEAILKENKKLNKMVELMTENLTTPTHNKDWVIKYFEDEVELEDGEY